MANRAPTRRSRRLLCAAMLLGVFAMSGCGQIVKGVAMVPIKVAETVAVETAKLPFHAAAAGADAAIDAIFKGK